MSELLSEDVEWCKLIWRGLSEGGVWGVPRSGLIFRKSDGKLVLIDRMPVMPGMPLSEKELEEYQDSDYEVIREHFAAAGIEVEKQ